MMSKKDPEFVSEKIENQAVSLCRNRHVYIIDDDAHIRRSLHFLLSTIGFVGWPFSSGSDFLDNLSTLTPAPIVLDIRMPDIDGIELMKVLADRSINWPTIIVTAHADIPTAVYAMRLGAIEFLEKPLELARLDSALHAAMAQLSVIKKAAATQEAAHGRYRLLSPRERAVLTILMEGLPNKVAAHRLSLSVRTVEMHRANALQKLQVRSLAEAIQITVDQKINIGRK